MKADFTKLARAFNPECVAIVGDSGGFQWIRAHENYTGKLYSVQVNPKTIESIKKLGVENYTSLVDIPEPVDLAIVAVGRKVALRVLEDCIKKDVAAAHFFTAGFSETDTEEGRELERHLKKMAEDANFHVIGPNCMGLYNPRIGIKQAMGQYDGAFGPVGFISQSGTHAINFGLEAHLQGLDIEKSVSFGNGTVLDCAEYLEFFGQDDEIKVIGMYLEGVRDGRRFLEVLKKVSRQKPVVIWKGGRAEGGARAIASHTGSLAVPQAIWDAAMRQGGAVTVASMEELIDALKALLLLPSVQGNRVGLTGGSGGQSVAITDAFNEAGLEVPRLTKGSYEELSSFFNLVGGGYGNPIDTGNSNRAELERIMDVIERDINIDNLVLLMGVGMGGGPQDPNVDGSPPQDRVPGGVDSVLALRNKTSKPVLAAVYSAFSAGSVREARRVIKKLQEGGVPAFVTVERAAIALKHALDYYSIKNSATS